MTVPTLFPEMDSSYSPEMESISRTLLQPFRALERQVEGLAQYLGEDAGLLRPLIYTLNERLEPGIEQVLIEMNSTIDLRKKAEKVAAEGNRVLREQQDREVAGFADNDQAASLVRTLLSLREVFIGAGLGQAVEAMTVALQQAGVGDDLPVLADGSPVLQALQEAERKADPTFSPSS